VSDSAGRGDHAGADTGAFSEERPRLMGLAYRMTGSLTDAEDVVQDTWLRWSAADRDTILNPAAWLTTVVTRLSLDRIRAAERRRADYVGEWLPEPVATDSGPAETVELAESLTLGFLVVLDRLAPTDRAVFLLADVFHEPYSAIAASVGKSETACRQIASRARHKVRDGRHGWDVRDRPAGPGARAGDPDLLAKMLTALVADDAEQLLQLLDPEVVLVSDGGPTRRAARHPVVGPDRVARLMLNLARRNQVGAVRVLEVNGRPALVLDPPDGRFVLQIDEHEGRIRSVWAVLNPSKLGGLDGVAAIR
jgi:RNA polymerase sigma-70 factor, ECF subfamily